MAGLEGAPSAVESHLHGGEGQVGDKIFAALRITVLHLGKERCKLERETDESSITTTTTQASHRLRSIPASGRRVSPPAGEILHA